MSLPYRPSRPNLPHRADNSQQKYPLHTMSPIGTREQIARVEAHIARMATDANDAANLRTMLGLAGAR